VVWRVYRSIAHLTTGLHPEGLHTEGLHADVY
jgi:hypothetical protein